MSTSHRGHRPAVAHGLLALGLVAVFADIARAEDDVGTREAGTAQLDEIVVIGSAPQVDVLSLDTPNLTGSRLGLDARDLPASVSVVTREMIELRGARTALEAIESAVGMSGGTSVGSIPNYATRGFTGNDITVMRDGIRQNTASQSARPLDAFLFDRIEVLKGPASLLYGEGAVGGAVNYVSKQAPTEHRGEAQFSAGSWDSYRAAAGAGGPTGVQNLYFRADASTSRRGGYVDNSDSRYDALAGELRWQPSADTSLRLSGTVLADETLSYYGTPLVYDAVIAQDGTQSVRRASTATDRLVNARIEPGTRRNNYNNGDNFADGSNSFWRAIAQTRLSTHWTLRNETYFATQRLDWRNTESAVWNPETQLVDRSSFLLIYRDDEQIGNRLDLSWEGSLLGMKNQFLIGGFYDRNDQDRNSGQSGVPGSPTPASVTLHDFDPGYGPDVRASRTVGVLTRNTAIYVEDVLSVGESLKLVGGLRYDHIDVERRSYVGAEPYDKRYEPLTGRFGAVYALTPAVNVYASYSRAAQPVSQLVSLNASQDDFSLQKGRQYEVGIKASALGGRASMTLALFDIEKNDLLTSTIVDGTRINSQIGAQVSQGAELALSLVPARGWQIDANLAPTWTAEYEDFNENLGTGVISRDGNTPPNVPKMVAGLYLMRSWPQWSLQGGLRYIGEREANNNNGIQLADYTALDAAITRRWKNLSLTLRGRNLTDERYAEWSSAGGLMLRMADPRSAELGMRLTF